MAEPQKNMSGVLFKNDRRRFWMDAWTNTVQRGERQGDKYVSIRFRAAEDRPERTPQPPVADSDLPF